VLKQSKGLSLWIREPVGKYIKLVNLVVIAMMYGTISNGTWRWMDN